MSANAWQAVLIDGLAAVPIEKAAQWYCELNCLHWPDDFPLPKPENYDGMHHLDKRRDTMPRMVFDTVSAFVPKKEQSRAWHKGGYCGERKTDQEFEAWWEQKGRAYFERS